MRLKLAGLLCCILNLLIAQEQINLIPNPSFEDVNICTKYKEACCPEAWRSTTLKAFYFFNDEDSNNPKNMAKDGHRFVSICMHNTKRSFDRGFIQTPLLCTLKAEQAYELSFYFKTPHNQLEEFGVLFLDTMLIKKNNKHLKESPTDLTFRFDTIISKEKWIFVRDTFIARGDEKVLLIGNVNSDQKTKVIPLGKRKKRRYDNTKYRTYYLFDHFNLRPITSNPSCNTEKQKALIYTDNVRHTIPIKKELVNSVEIASSKPPTPKAQPKFLVIEEDSILISETFELPNILFATNSDRLLPVAYPSLQKLSNYLLINRQYKIFITGHTDNVGSDQANQRLSERRAKAVRNYLIHQGIANIRIHYEGKGEVIPIQSNDSEEGRSQNRRVEFRLEKE